MTSLLERGLGSGAWRVFVAEENGRVVSHMFVRLIEKNLDNASMEIQLESFARELKHGFEMQV